MANRVATQTDVDNTTYSTWIDNNLVPYYGDDAHIQIGDYIWYDDSYVNNFAIDSVSSNGYAGVTSNPSGQAYFDVTSTITSDHPQPGVLIVEKTAGSGDYDFYRYSSYSGVRFTLDIERHPNGLIRNYGASNAVRGSKLRVGFNIYIDTVGFGMDISNPSITLQLMTTDNTASSDCFDHITEYTDALKCNVYPLLGQIVCKGTGSGLVFSIKGIPNIRCRFETVSHPGLRDPFSTGNFLHGTFGYVGWDTDRAATHMILWDPGFYADKQNEPSFECYGAELIGGFSGCRIMLGGYSAGQEVECRLFSFERNYRHDADTGEGVYIWSTAGSASSTTAASGNNLGDPTFTVNDIITLNEDDGFIEIDNGEGGWDIYEYSSYVGTTVTLNAFYHPNGLTRTYNQYDAVRVREAKPYGTEVRLNDNVFARVATEAIQMQDQANRFRKKSYRNNVVLASASDWIEPFQPFQSGLLQVVLGDGNLEIANNIFDGGRDNAWTIFNTYTKRGEGLGEVKVFNNLWQNQGDGAYIHNSTSGKFIEWNLQQNHWKNRDFRKLDRIGGHSNWGHLISNNNGTNIFEFKQNYKDSTIASNWFEDSSDFGHIDNTVDTTDELQFEQLGFEYGDVDYPNRVYDYLGIFGDNGTTYKDGEIVTEIKSTETYPMIRFYKNVSGGNIVANAGYLPSANPSSWDRIYWDVNGVRSDNISYTGTPDPTTGGLFPPENCHLVKGSYWQKRGLGLSTNPTDEEVFQLQESHDNSTWWDVPSIEGKKMVMEDIAVSGYYYRVKHISQGDQIKYSPSLLYGTQFGSGVYTMTGTDVAFTINTTDISMNAAPGVYNYTGTEANLEWHMQSPVDSGTYSMVGSDMNTEWHRVMLADSDTFTLTGTAAEFLLNPALIAEYGLFTMVGTDASFKRDIVMESVPGTFVMQGTDASFSYGNILEAVPGTYSMVGTDAALISSAPGIYLKMDWVNHIIKVLAPTTEVDAQTLHDFIENEMHSPEGLYHEDVIQPEGKIEDPTQPGVYSQIILVLNPTWQIQFWQGSGYTKIYGGKLVGGVNDQPMKATGAAGDITVLESPVDGLAIATSALTEEDKTDIAKKVVRDPETYTITAANSRTKNL